VSDSFGCTFSGRAWEVVVVEAENEDGGDIMGSSLEAFERLGEVEKGGFLPNVPCASEMKPGLIPKRKRS